MRREEENVLMRFRHITNHMTKQLDKWGSQYNITAIQALILNEIAQEENITVTRLGNNLDLSKANISAILKRMENAELIEKHRDHQDQRKVYLHLTPHGQNLYKQLQQDIQSRVPTWERLEEYQRKAIIDILDKLEAIIKGEKEDE